LNKKLSIFTINKNDCNDKYQNNNNINFISIIIVISCLMINNLIKFTVWLEKTQPKPKSPILSIPLAEINILAGFKSLCIILFSLIWYNPPEIYKI